MAGGRHLGFRFWGYNFWTVELDTSNLAQAFDAQKEHGGIRKIDKNQYPRWPPAAILDFCLEAITFERHELDTLNLALGQTSTKGTWRTYRNWQKSQIQDVRFRYGGHNVWPASARHFKFGADLEIHEENLAELPKWKKVKSKMA